MSNENNKPAQAPANDATSGIVLKASPAQQLDLRSYLDYREYLADWYQARKSLQTSYSGALFAKKAGIQSHTLLGMVIRGDRNLTPNTIRAFIKAIGLGARDANYFEKLVLFNQAKKADDRAYYFAQLQSVLSQNKETPISKLSNYSRYLSHWYIIAIREMAALGDFREDPQWIAVALKNRITPKQAREAIEILLELQMLVKKPQADGTVKLEATEVLTDSESPKKIDFAIRSYHREYLKVSEHALDHDDPKDRLFNSVTLSVQEHQIPALHDEFDTIRKDLLSKYGTVTQNADQVITVNFQFLKLTKTERKTP